jgi:hypothetical protein
VIWGVSDNKKSFENMACYANKNIPEKFKFGEVRNYFYLINFYKNLLKKKKGYRFLLTI